MRITDTLVAASGTDKPWWYSIHWNGDRIERIEDASGWTFVYKYDATGNLNQLILPGDFGSYSISYAADGEVIASIRFPGTPATVRYTFDAEGRLMTLTGPDGQTWTVAVNAAPAPDHSEISLTSPGGVRWAARLREIPTGMYVSSREARGTRETFERTDAGYLRVSTRDHGRESSIYTPDDRPRPGHTMQIKHVFADGTVEDETEFELGPYGNLVRSSRTPGGTTRFEYAGVDDCDGTGKDPWSFLLPCRVRFGPDDDDREITMAHRSEATGTPNERRISVTRDSHQPLSDGLTIRDRFGRPIEQRTARGMHNQVAYSARGFPQSVSVSVGGMTGAPGHVSGAVYDPMGRPLRQTMGPPGAPTTWAVEATPGAGGFVDDVRMTFHGEMVERIGIENRHPTGLPTDTVHVTAARGEIDVTRLRQPRNAEGRQFAEVVELRDSSGEVQEFRSGTLATQ